MDKSIDDGTIARQIRAVASGSNAAFTLLYRDLNRKVRLACERVLPPALAEDALQETFLKLWTRAGAFDASRSSGSAWIECIARNTALDLLRKHQRDDTVAADWQVDGRDAGPLVVLQSLRRSDAVMRGIERLRDGEKESLRLAFLQDMSQAQIAFEMRQPLGTVKSWVRRGMAQMRSDLSSCYPLL